MELEGSVALVTGAGSGIGKATAVRFANEGAQVAFQDGYAGRKVGAAICCHRAAKLRAISRQQPS